MDAVTRLKNVPLFAALTPDKLARVAEVADRQAYPKDSRLCRQDEFGKTLYIVDAGEAVLRQADLSGVERPVGYLRVGDVFGDDALLFGDAYSSCLQSTTELEVLAIRKERFDRLLEEHPEIGKQLRLRPLLRDRLRTPTFPWLEPDERAVLLRRRHWFALAKNLLIPAVVWLAFGAGAWLLIRTGVMKPALTIFVLISFPPAAVVLWHYLDWRNDFYLVTDKRVLHEEKTILLHESWEEARLSKIQSIDIRRDIIGSMLGFGTMLIYTASARGTLLLDHLPDPAGMQEVIFKSIGRVRLKGREQEREDVRQELLRQIGRLDQEPEPLLFPPYAVEQGNSWRKLMPQLGLRRPLFSTRFKKGELIVWRKHWIFLLERIRIALPAFLITTAVTLFVAVSSWLLPYRSAAFLGSVILWVALLLWLWWEIEDWRNDLYILGDRVIIDVEKRPLFLSEQRKQASLEMIQNVSLQKRGLLSSLLDFGDVVIETAGAAGSFTFDGVGHPVKVQQAIFRRIEELGEARQQREREQRKADLATWFQIYHQLNQEGQPPGSE
jgi:hypothetical protein